MIRAILIDDEKWSRNIIRSFGKWEDLGIEIVGEAEDGDEGLELFEQLNPQIIITDMNMPNLDGVALLKILDERVSRAKIIIISGFDDFSYMKQAIQSKAFEYLLKPIDGAELNKVLERCIRAIHLDTQNDPANLYRQIDAGQLKKLVEQRRFLSDALQRRDLAQAASLLKAIASQVLPLVSEEKVAVRLLVEHLNSVIHEQLLVPAQYDSILTDPLNQLRREAESGLALSDWLTQMQSVLQKWSQNIRTSHKLENRPIAELAQEFIQQHYRENISLEAIASHFYISKEYLSSAYKTKYQSSVGQAILRLKMENAKEQLKSGRSPSDVAESLAYQDRAYFYKVYKKYFGHTPSEFLGIQD